MFPSLDVYVNILH